MRWYLWFVIPMVRADGPDITRSAAGHVALEMPLLLPSALLPEAGVRWEAVDERSARVRLMIGREELVPVISVAPDGRLERVEMMRWDPDGMNGIPDYVRWVGDGFAEERTFAGHTIPTVVRVTKKADTPQADAFFAAVIESAQYR